MSEKSAKEIKVNIDTSPMEARIKAQYEEQLKTRDETIKALLAQDAERIRLESERKTIEAQMDKKPIENYGETAPLENEHIFRNVDFENSDFLDIMKFPSVEKAIESTQLLACKNNPQAKLALKQLTKKVLQQKLDMTFVGSIKDMVKSEVPIGEFDDQFTRKQKQAHNAHLRENRTRWVQN
jgi:hypothetical protein